MQPRLGQRDTMAPGRATIDLLLRKTFERDCLGDKCLYIAGMALGLAFTRAGGGMNRAFRKGKLVDGRHIPAQVE